MKKKVSLLQLGLILSLLLINPLNSWAVKGLVEVDTAGNLAAGTGVSGVLPVANGGTGLATLTDKNVILGAGTSTPTFVAPGTSGNVLTSDGATWASSALAAAAPESVVTKTTTYLATTADATILSDGTFTITLYTAVGNSGRKLTIKNVGTGSITIDPNSTETIDGDATSLVISIRYTSYTLQSDGTNWFII